jgi:hypothetical protein
MPLVKRNPTCLLYIPNESGLELEAWGIATEFSKECRKVSGCKCRCMDCVKFNSIQNYEFEKLKEKKDYVSNNEPSLPDPEGFRGSDF